MESQWGAWVVLIAGVLIAGLGIPLIAQRVPPNRLYGYRTPATLQDERVWYPVNQSMGWFMLGSGALVAVLTLVAIAGWARFPWIAAAVALGVSGPIGIAYGYHRVLVVQRQVEDGDNP